MSRLAMAGVAIGWALVLAGGSGAAPAKKGAASLVQFPFPSGKVTYKLSSLGGAGTGALSWMESGHKFRQDTRMVLKQGDRTIPVDGWMMYDGTYLYTHQAMMGKNVYRSKPGKPGTSLGMGLPMVSGNNMGKVVGKDTVLGKPCEVRQSDIRIGKLKIWTWKNLPLKMHIDPARESAPPVDAVATALTPAKVAASQFKLPAGYTVVGPGTPGAARMGARPGKRGVAPVQ
jgi:hypothetical protein